MGVLPSAKQRPLLPIWWCWQASSQCNKTWEILSINQLLSYFPVSNKPAKKFVHWHDYVTGSQELFLISIRRNSQLPLWANPLLWEQRSTLTVPLFCMLTWPLFFSSCLSVTVRWHRAALSHQDVCWQYPWWLYLNVAVCVACTWKSGLEGTSGEHPVQLLQLIEATSQWILVITKPNQTKKNPTEQPRLEEQTFLICKNVEIPLNSGFNWVDGKSPILSVESCVSSAFCRVQFFTSQCRFLWHPSPGYLNPLLKLKWEVSHEICSDYKPDVLPFFFWRGQKAVSSVRLFSACCFLMWNTI